ncbi:conserved hypothetical protein [Trichinella spiralis]|uniref:hypothetical protein n=1 Tax=Trichinella spiralis TaxID=6334 RepID=UPI0001EFDBAC|nr:conserved hypothetical protein [Trichinella spiralis]
MVDFVPRRVADWCSILLVSAKNLDKLCNELGSAQVDGDGAEVKDHQTAPIDRVECVSQSHILPWWFQGIDCGITSLMTTISDNVTLQKWRLPFRADVAASGFFFVNHWIARPV